MSETEDISEDSVPRGETKDKKHKGRPRKETQEKNIDDESDEDFEKLPERKRKKGTSKGSDKKKESSVSESKRTTKVPLLDQALIVDGSRSRKTFTADMKTEIKSSKFACVQIPKGKGTPLMKIECINVRLKRSTPNDLKDLHKILFGKIGDPDSMVANLQKFHGLPIEKNSDKYHTRISQINKLRFGVIKHISYLLDLDLNAKKKEEVAKNLADFLVEPSESLTAGTPGPEVRKKRKATKRNYAYMDADEGGPRKKKKVKLTQPVSRKEETVNISSKRSRAAENSKKYVEDGSKKDGSKSEVNIESKKPAKKRKRNQDFEKWDVKNDDVNVSEDEVKDEEKTKLSNEELRKFLEKVLIDANLEKTTMKTVYGLISDQYPKFNFSSKKEFIKNVVKSVGGRIPGIYRVLFDYLYDARCK